MQTVLTELTAQRLARAIVKEAPRAQVTGITEVTPGVWTVGVKDIISGVELQVQSVEQWELVRPGFQAAPNGDGPAPTAPTKARFTIWCTEEQHTLLNQAATILHQDAAEFGRNYLLPFAHAVVTANTNKAEDAPPRRGPKRQD